MDKYKYYVLVLWPLLFTMSNVLDSRLLSGIFRFNFLSSPSITVQVHVDQIYSIQSSH